MKSFKAHQRYKTKDGKIVPGVTTVLGILNKPALVKWANGLGLQGIDVTKYVDKMAEIGTLAHYMIECEFKSEKPELEEYSPVVVDKAENSLISFYDWVTKNNVRVIASELELVSEKLKYGGKIDLYGIVNGKKTLVDFKTSGGIYPEMIIQLAAYRNLLEENGYEVEECRILRVGRDESEGWEERKITDTRKHFKLFKHCLEIYRLKKQIEKACKGE